MEEMIEFKINTNSVNMEYGPIWIRSCKRLTSCFKQFAATKEWLLCSRLFPGPKIIVLPFLHSIFIADRYIYVYRIEKLLYSVIWSTC